MINTLLMLEIILVIAFAAFATRAFPFLCFGSREPPVIILTIEKKRHAQHLYWNSNLYDNGAVQFFSFLS
jgi:hypothetical protein